MFCKFVQLFNLKLFLTLNIYLFNCLTLNIKLLIFKLFGVKFLLSINHVFHKQKKTAIYKAMDVRPQFRTLNSHGKMMVCYLRGINKFLRYHTLCKGILKCGFRTKGIELTRFLLFEYSARFRPFRCENLRNKSEALE